MPKYAVEMDFRVMVWNERRLKQLETEMRKLAGVTKDMKAYERTARMEMARSITETKESNRVMKAKLDIGRGYEGNRTDLLRLDAQTAVQQEQLQMKYDATFAAEKRIYQQLGPLTDAQRTQNQAQIENIYTSERQRVAMESAMHANRSFRWAIMQCSISLFVMNISIHQLIGSLDVLFGENEAMKKSFQDIGKIIQLSIAPLQVYFAMTQMVAMAHKTYLAPALMATTTAMLGLYFLYRGLTEKSKELKALFIFLAGVMFTLTALAIKMTIAKWRLAIATGAEKTAETYGAAAPAILGGWASIVGGGILLSALAAAGVYAAGAQTMPGELRLFRRGGLVTVHPGEIYRPAEVSRATPATGSETIVNVNLYGVTTVEEGILPQLSREVEVAVLSGLEG